MVRTRPASTTQSLDPPRALAPDETGGRRAPPAARAGCHESRRPRTIDHRTSIYRDAIAIIEIEYGSDLRLDDVAHRVASSRRQLQRAFAEIGQTSFVEHVTTVRVQHAAEMLATRAMSIRDIAHRVGYRHAAHFAKAFRLHHGVTPSEYRSQQRGVLRRAP